MRYTNLPLTGFALLLFLTGCSDNEAPPNVPTPDIETPAVDEFVPDVAPPVAPVIVRYHCAPGLTVEARYQGEAATLVIANKEYRLTQEPAASGARYSDAQLQWHTKGDEAVLTGTDEMHVCLRMDDDTPAASEPTQ